jgi:oxygen-dependent protoporphyrinogen oxidase
MKRIAIVGGGIAGVTAAWQLARLALQGSPVEAVLFEASSRLGGIVETVREDGFTMECGPDGWVTEKPWVRELVEELGLEDQLLSSNDATRKTYVVSEANGRPELIAMPDRMRMMVPAGLAALDALDRSPLFSAEAKAAYRAEVVRAEELKAAVPDCDESVANFVERHFGHEVLEKIGAPLLGGVFGGNVHTLSVRAVMAPFVQIEREHGSLILALERALERRAISSAGPSTSTIFTTLRDGLGTLIDAMVAAIPEEWIRLNCPVQTIAKENQGWRIETRNDTEEFDALLLAAPVYTSAELLRPIDPEAASLMRLETSSAVLAGFAFKQHFELPEGFGFLVPPRIRLGEIRTQERRPSLLAGTFVDQKFNHRAPAGGRLLRGFFGGATADRLLASSDAEVAALTLSELEKVLGTTLPAPDHTIVRRWPHALPQYGVGHLERMAELSAHVDQIGKLRLLGNGYHGVGLPDLIRDARAAARQSVLD